METLVLTVIGDDRAGLVSALAEVIAAHEGSWSRSQLAELAGKFAGIVEVTVPDVRVEALTAALRPLDGLLDVAVHAASTTGGEPRGERISFELVGNDRVGIVQEITTVLRDHRITIDRLSSDVTDAPMGGGQLFQATIHARAAESADLESAQDALEQLAGELMVEVQTHRS